MPIELTRAMVGDLETLLRIELSVSSKLYSPYDAQELRALIAGEGGEIYLIKCDGEIVGSTSVEFEQVGGIGFASLVILPPYRGNGIGTQVFEMRLKMYRDQGYRHFFRHVHPENAASLALLKDCDVKVIDRIPNAFGDGEPRVRIDWWFTR